MTFEECLFPDDMSHVANYTGTEKPNKRDRGVSLFYDLITTNFFVILSETVIL